MVEQGDLCGRLASGHLTLQCRIVTQETSKLEPIRHWFHSRRFFMRLCHFRKILVEESQQHLIASKIYDLRSKESLE
jgi:hypothetical protein